jgi:hypothetical protein
LLVVRYALLGALLAVGGIAAQIVAHRHRPGLTSGAAPSGYTFGFERVSVGWSSTAYDLVRVGGWALLIFGAITVAFALIREIRR